MEINFERAIELAQNRLRDVITAANKADTSEMFALVCCSICGGEDDYESGVFVQTSVTLLDDKESIYFRFQGYEFHLTMDKEFDSTHCSDLYHIWCTCDYFKNEEMPMHQVYVDWLCGACSIKDNFQKYNLGQISKEDFEHYIYEDVNICISNWLDKNKEFIKR